MPSPSYKFSIHSLERPKTHFWSDFIQAYFEGDTLSDLRHTACSLDGIAQLIEERKSFSPNKRKLLQNALREQYNSSGIDLEENPLARQIESLADENCFTITTGQQIHFGLGPMYVLYKIWNTLALAKELKAHFPKFHFVPIFWMAAEDHDFEEICDLKLFGRSHTWVNEQAGAVGRMNTAGLRQLITDIRSEYRLSTHQLRFLALAEEAYSLDNYANASRHLLHSLFGHEGLLILDGDDQGLKESWSETVISELKGDHYKKLKASTEALEAKGFEAQIHIRKINLFYLSENSRERIVLKDGKFTAGDQLLCEEKDIDSFVRDQAANISPNVALRPLYQECILPNLIYVGGPAEIKYWHQLKGLFDHYSLHMPALYLRTSAVYLGAEIDKGLDVSELGLYYGESSALIDQAAESMQVLRASFDEKLNGIKGELSSYSKEFKQAIKGANLDGKINKLYPKITELQHLSNDLIDQYALQNPELKRMLKWQERYFNSDKPQERESHLLEFAELCFSSLWAAGSFGLDNLLKINHLVAKSV